MMKTLDDCKDIVAKKYGFNGWMDYCAFMINTKVKLYKTLLATDEVAQLFASQF